MRRQRLLARLCGALGRFLSAPALHRAGAVFLVAFGLRFAWISLLDVPLAHDGWYYFHGARTLAQGDGYRDFFTGEQTAAMPAGYPLVLSGLFVVFGTELFVARLFNAVVGAAAAALTYVLGRRVCDERTGLMAGALMAFFPSQIFFTSMVMTESFFVALSVLLLTLLVWWLARGSAMQNRQVLALGVLLGFMSLVRAEVLMLAVMLVALWKVCGWRWSEIGRAFLLLAVGMAVILAPWTVRNYVQLDRVIIVRAAGETVPFSTLRIGLSPDFDDPKYRSFAQPPSAQYLVEYYTEHPWEIAKHGPRKINALFGGEGAFYWVEQFGGTDFTSETAAPWETLGDVFYYAVGFVALVGAPVWLRRRDRPLLVLLWFAISWTIIHLIFRPQPRYHYPILPVVCVLAAMVVVEAWGVLREHRLPTRAVVWRRS